MSPTDRLIFEYGGNTTQVVELDPSRHYVLGRDRDCEIILQEKSVSRRHLRIWSEQGQWCFEDISNNNGISVGGKLLREVRPKHGDSFFLGRVKCTYAAAGALLEDSVPFQVHDTLPQPEQGEAEPEVPPAAPPPQPIVLCPVCGTRVQIIDFATVDTLSCHGCRAGLGRLAIRHLEVSGIYSSVKVTTDPRSGPSLRVGEYRIVREIGAGGMGKVFLAVDPLTSQTVALKILHPRKEQEKILAEAFENEARALARIFHKNIVKIYRFGLHGQNLYIAMEFIEGTNVKKMIEERRKLPLKESLEIMRQALVGLDFIHLAGIVHNDIKPSNILVASDTTVKLVDFGIVQIGQPIEEHRRSVVAGTVGYLCPELLQGGPPTPQSDLYALGITVYYMLCGLKPLQGKSPEETRKLHIEQPPPNPKQHRELPHELACLIARLLAKTPQQRYPTAGSVLDDLDAMDLGKPLNRETINLGKPWR